jgi:hypothetical protein
MLQCFRACWHFPRCLATSHMTLVIPVCSRNISGRLEIIFSVYSKFSYIYLLQKMQSNKQKIYDIILRQYVIGNLLTAQQFWYSIHFCGILSKTPRFKENLFNRKYEFNFLFSTSLQNVFHYVKCLFGDDGDG